MILLGRTAPRSGRLTTYSATIVIARYQSSAIGEGEQLARRPRPATVPSGCTHSKLTPATTTTRNSSHEPNAIGA